LCLHIRNNLLITIIIEEETGEEGCVRVEELMQIFKHGHGFNVTLYDALCLTPLLKVMSVFGEPSTDRFSPHPQLEPCS
jgi:hypothetical protein